MNHYSGKAKSDLSPFYDKMSLLLKLLPPTEIYSLLKKWNICPKWWPTECPEVHWKAKAHLQINAISRKFSTENNF